MSVDLFVVREEPLSWTEACRAYDALAVAHEGVSFWQMTDDAQDATVYFWHVGRVTAALMVPEPEDADEHEPLELAMPCVVVSSRSGAWPWIEWTAVTLARQLHARVFDPQSGEMVGPSTPEHDLVALRRLHDEYLREVQPKLVSSWWACTHESDATPAGLRRHVEVIEAVSKEILGVALHLELAADQVNLWHTHRIGDAELSVSTLLDSPAEVEPSRTFHVEGPCGHELIGAYADTLGRRLGVCFRRVDEYR